MKTTVIALLKKLVVAYRNNNLFEKYVPAILSHIPTKITVEKIVYPADANDSDIARDLESRLRVIKKPFYLLSDETCRGRSYADKYDPRKSLAQYLEELESTQEKITCKRKKAEIKLLPTLDRIFSDEVRVLMVETGNFRDIVARLTSKQFPLTSPSAIFIVTNKIADHPADDNGELLNYDYEERKEKYSSFLMSVFREIYPSATIQKVKGFYDEHGDKVILEDNILNNPNNLIVVDRHEYGGRGGSSNEWFEIKWPYQAKLFWLPFSNALIYLRKLNLIQVDFDGTALYCRLELEKKI